MAHGGVDSMPTCAIYARVSTDHQGDSVDHQITLMTAYAQSKGPDWTIDERHVYRDDGKSGTSIVHRTAVQRMIKHAEQKMFDVILFKGISRFARDIVDAVQMLRVLRSAGIRVISFEEGYDSGQGDSDLIFQIHASVAEHESKKIGLRTKLGHRETAKRGKWAKGRPPFGYLIGENKKLQLHPDQAPIVKQIYDMYVNQGCGMFSIAKYLNEHGIKTNFNQLWSQVTIRLLLQNEVYMGKIVYGIRRHEKKYVNGETEPTIVITRNKDEDIISVENAHATIVDEMTWRQAQEITKSRRVNRTGGETHLLSGILKCPNCGTSTVSHSSSRILKDGTKREYRFYKCGKRRKFGTAACSFHGIESESIEEEVIGTLNNEFEEYRNKIEDLRDIIMNNVQSKFDPVEVVRVLQRQIDDVDSQIVNANLKNAKGIINDSAFSIIVRELNNEKEKLENALIELSGQLMDKKEIEQQIDLFISYVNKFINLDKITNKNKFEARAILSQILEYVKIKNGEPVIKLRFDIRTVESIQGTV